MKHLNAAEERFLKNAVILAAQASVFRSLSARYGLGAKLVKQCTKIGSGSTPRGGKSVYVSDGIPFVRSLNVRHYEFQEENLVKIPHEVGESMPNTRVLAGDVFLNITGASIGRSCVAPEKICPANVNQHVTILRPIPEILDSRFLMYWLNDSNTQEEIDTIQRGATRQALTKKQIENFRLPAVPLEEQKQVIRFLEAVRLKQDFTDIELPQHLKQIPSTVVLIRDLASKVEEARGLRSETVREARALLISGRAKVFKKAAKQKTVHFSDLANLERGKFSHRPRNDSRFFGGDHPWIQIAEIEASGKHIRHWSQTLNDEGLAISRKFPKGTLLISIAATIRAVGILDFDCCVPDSIVAVIPKPEINSEYIYHYLCYLRTNLENIAPQNAQKNINLKILEPLPIPNLSFSEQGQIVTYLDTLQEKVDELEQLQFETEDELNALLPSILSKAFKGEL
ncbi:restriction modification system DNA specificity domain protein (plasmid) [Leptolyngbya sp. NIES-3755]|nr:restriction modification system DNA specificity domain protein [Leptolyngbya sp. NIES-3755]